MTREEAMRAIQEDVERQIKRATTPVSRGDQLALWARAVERVSGHRVADIFYTDDQTIEFVIGDPL